MGSDYPFEDMDGCIRFLDDQPMSDTEREQMYAGTATAIGMAL